MTGTTGHPCPKTGIWRGDCPDREQIALSRGETFPPCGGYRRPVTWTLIQATE
jgi:hypothetical protein